MLQGLHIVGFKSRHYIGNAGGGGGQIVATLWRIPLAGTAGSIVAQVSDSTAANAWVEGADATVDHFVDWDTYTYYIEVALRATTDLANMRFMLCRVLLAAR
jgi:hypothetical protein